MRSPATRLGAAVLVVVALAACSDETSSDTRCGEPATDGLAGPVEGAEATAPELDGPPEIAERLFEILVLDEDREPIPGARVRLFATDEPTFSFLFGPPPNAEQEAAQTVETNGAGIASLSVEEGARASLVIDAPGKAARTRELAEDFEARVEVTLDSGHVLEGVVTDQHGLPVVGARVRFGGSVDRFTGLEPEVHTDAEGWYRFDGAPANVVQVNVSPPGVTSSRVAAVVVPSVRRFDVELEVYGPITGVVRHLERNQPIEGVSVVAELGGFHSESVTATAVTDAEGRYEIPVWPRGGVGRVTPRREGWYWTASPDGSESTHLPFPAEGALVVDLWMSPGARIEGTATGPDGAVADVSVNLYAQRHESRWSTDTDTDGKYSFDGVPPGDYLFLHEHNEYVGADWPGDPHGVVRKGGELPTNGIRVTGAGTITHDIRLDRGVVVTGLVQGPDGEVRPDVRVYGGNGHYDRADPEGRFTLSGLPRDADVSVGVVGLEGGGSSLELSRDDIADGHADVALLWRPGAEARGERDAIDVRVDVRDEDGNPVPGAQVAASRFGSFDELGAVTSRLDWGGRAPAGVATTRVRPVGDEIGVFARAEGFAPGAVEVSTGTAGEILTAELELVPEAVLRGLVVSADDDAPIEGVRVALTRPSTFTGIACRMGQDIGPTTVATTDAAGAFEVRGLPSGEVEITFAAAGFVTAKSATHLRHGEAKRLRQALLRPRTLAGHVVSADGSPVAGVNVRAWRNWDSVADADEGGGSARTDTDAEGAFVLRGLGAGTFDVTATPPGGGADFVEVELQEVDPDDGAVRIVLAPFRTLAGVVRDPDGKPVRDAKVHYSLVGDEGSYAREVVTDALGRFQVLAPQASAVRLDASGLGFAPTRVTVDAGDDAADIVLTRGLSIAGTLRDEDGNPIVGAPIEARRVDGTTEFDEVPQATTDVEGRFAIHGLEPGDYALQHKYRFGEGSLFEPQVLAAGDEGVTVVELRPADIDVLFVDDRGDVIPDFAFNLGRGNHSFVLSTDASGRGAHRGLRPGSEWSVEVEKLGTLKEPERRLVAGADEAPIVVLDVQRLSGRVVDAAGKPFADVELGLRASEGDDDRDHRVRTDEDGRFRLYGMTATKYAVRLYVAGEAQGLLDTVGVEDDLVFTSK